MKLLNLVQGSPEWLAARSKYNTASEAPAMAGISPYMSRNDLLLAKHTGEQKEVSAATQKVFDRGHESEAAIRPVIERDLGEDLFPCTVVDDDGWLSASLDGMTMNRKTIWEHKQFSQAKVNWINEHQGAPETDYLQVQQQLMLTGAERCLYTVGNDPDNLARVWVKPNEGAFEDIRSGWAQFDKDLDAYTITETEPEAVGHSMESLPALHIAVTGTVTASNLVKYKETAIAVFDEINTDLQTDQDFADAESTVKWCKDVEDRLKGAKQHALSQTESIDELFRAIDDLAESARQKRLELSKLVTARKAVVRNEIRQGAAGALAEHLSGLEERLDSRARVPRPDADFASAMKGKRTITSLRDAVDQVLADAKIASSAQADSILANLKTFDELAAEYSTLFPDIEQLSYKAPEDFTAAVKLRISEHKEAEEKRAEVKRKAEEDRKAREAEVADKAASSERSARPSKPETSAVTQFRPGEDATAPPLNNLETGNNVATRRWQVTATFEIEAPEQYGAQEIAGRLRSTLSHLESLRDVSAEEKKAA